MEIYTQIENIRVISIQVTIFPVGVKESFESLMKTLGTDRPYYGISWMDDMDKVNYYAMACETYSMKR